MASLETAINIALTAHEGQKDRYGAPFIGHILRVMNAGRTEDEKIVGVLHDLIEKTEWSFEALEAEGFSSHLIEAIRCLSKKDEHEPYDALIERAKGNRLALRVKLNDLRDNMDISRAQELSEEDRIRLNKYLKAYHELIQL